jgi:serine/threonine protein kinase
MGTVYLAEHRSTREQVAIKVISPWLACSPEAVRRFEAEARAVMRIDHPNVIRISGYDRRTDGRLYQVMELLDGCELSELLERRPRWSARETAPLVRQICAGLQAAHDHAVIHRDLKPANIFIQRTEPLALKVLDFGISKLLDSKEWGRLTATGVVLGTPLFIAPEQALGDTGRVGPRTDLYSLGVILYSMLCGEPPFVDVALGTLLAMHINDPPPPLVDRHPGVPVEVARVVHRCLEKDPERRPRSARDLAAEFSAAVACSQWPPRAITARGPRAAPWDEEPQRQDTVIDPRFAGDVLDLPDDPPGELNDHPPGELNDDPPGSRSEEDETVPDASSLRELMTSTPTLVDGQSRLGSAATWPAGYVPPPLPPPEAAPHDPRLLAPRPGRARRALRLGVTIAVMLLGLLAITLMMTYLALLFSE